MHVNKRKGGRGKNAPIVDRNLRLGLKLRAPEVEHAVIQAASQLGIPCLTVPRIPVTHGGPLVYVVSVDALNVVPVLPKDIIVVVDHSMHIEALLGWVAAGQIIPLPVRDITTSGLARALAQVIGSKPGGFAAALAGITEPPVPTEIVKAFIQNPTSLGGLTDLCRCLNASPHRVRGVLRRMGVGRAEYLLTAMRSEAWLRLTEIGLPRTQVERFLGISDRTNFRRSCERADVAIPWRAQV